MGNVGMRNYPGSIRILKADGKYLEFRDPVRLIQVIIQFPHHFVVRLSEALPKAESITAVQAMYQTSGNRGKLLSVLRADELLEPEQTYYLLPIPSKTRSCSNQHAARTGKSSSNVRSSFQLGNREEQHTSLPQPPHKKVQLEDAQKRIQDVQIIMNTLDVRMYRTKTRRTRHPIAEAFSMSWAPVLEQIPECCGDLSTMQSSQ